jgi:hypothetical protein
MSDLISNNPVLNNSSSAPKTTGPREDQTTQASEAQASSQAQETQSMQSAFATIVYNRERDSNSNSGYRGVSKNDKFVNQQWTTNTTAVLAA